MQPHVIPSVPPAADVQEQIGRLLRELHVARRLLTLAKLADRYRNLNQIATAQAHTAERQGVTHVA